jgi:hypothetical protein
MNVVKFEEFVKGTENFFTPIVWNSELPNAPLVYGLLIVQCNLDKVKLATIHNYAGKEIQQLLLQIFLKSDLGKPYSELEKSGMPILFVPSQKIVYGWSITPNSRSCFLEFFNQLDDKVKGYQKSIKGVEETGFPLQSTIPSKLSKSIKDSFKFWESKKTQEIVEEVDPLS